MALKTNLTSSALQKVKNYKAYINNLKYNFERYLLLIANVILNWNFLNNLISSCKLKIEKNIIEIFLYEKPRTTCTVLVLLVLISASENIKLPQPESKIWL